MHLVITAVYGQALGLQLELSNNCFNCCAEAHRIPPYSVVNENILFLLTNSVAGEVARGRYATEPVGKLTAEQFV